MAALAAGTAACSSDVNRFSDNNSFSNPFANSARNQPQQQQPAPAYAQGPSSRIESQPLPPQGGYQQQSYRQLYPQQGQQGYVQQAALTPAPQYPSQAVAPQAAPRLASTGRANPSYPEVTGSVPRASAPASGWTWEGGTAVTLAPGETIATLSRRTGVPASAIAQANGLAPNARVHPGQRLVIPRYQGATAAPAQPATTGSLRGTSQQNFVHVINPGETLMALSRKYNKSLSEIARANNLPVGHRVRVGERIVIPGLRASATQAATPQQATPQAAAAAAPRAPVTTQATQPAPAQPQRVASVEPAAQTAHVLTPAKDNPETEKTASVSEPAGSAGFRWPVRGRIISGFGPKPTGQQNDGINLAVPEGTPVKAADDGIVAYAGNELKGYGNLVLVRHANGYVTAYAHVSELLVKRGDSVRRGQVIAKSGQTGSVSSPQLHFEVRKGSTPVDPMQHLAGAS